MRCEDSVPVPSGSLQHQWADKNRGYVPGGTDAPVYWRPIGIDAPQMDAQCTVSSHKASSWRVANGVSRATNQSRGQTSAIESVLGQQTELAQTGCEFSYEMG